MMVDMEVGEMGEKTCDGCKDLKDTLQGIETALERIEAILSRIESLSAAKYADGIYEKCGAFRSYA